MEQSKALHKLNESTDLLKMVEDLIAPGALEKMAPSSWAGVRIILKNIRENIAGSQSVLTQSFIQRAKSNELNQNLAATQAPSSAPMVASRQDLKTSLARFIEKETT